MLIGSKVMKIEPACFAIIISTGGLVIFSKWRLNKLRCNLAYIMFKDCLLIGNRSLFRICYYHLLLVYIELRLLILLPQAFLIHKLLPVRFLLVELHHRMPFLLGEVENATC